MWTSAKSNKFWNGQSMREPSIGFNCHVKKSQRLWWLLLRFGEWGQDGVFFCIGSQKSEAAALASGPLRQSPGPQRCQHFLPAPPEGWGGGGSGAAKQTFQNVKKKQKEKIQGQQPPAATAFHPKLRLKIIAARSSQRRLSRSSTEKFAREISPWPSV